MDLLACYATPAFFINCTTEEDELGNTFGNALDNILLANPWATVISTIIKKILENLFEGFGDIADLNLIIKILYDFKNSTPIIGSYIEFIERAMGCVFPSSTLSHCRIVRERNTEISYHGIVQFTTKNSDFISLQSTVNMHCIEGDKISIEVSYNSIGSIDPSLFTASYGKINPSTGSEYAGTNKIKLNSFIFRDKPLIPKLTIIKLF